MLAFSIVAGLVLLVAGGDALVRGASALAARLGLSPLLIGLTVVGCGTSMPELVTSLQAAFDGAPGIAVGNVVGSNIANVLLILGVAAVLMPFAVARDTFRRDGTVLVAASLACALVVVTGMLTRPVGIVLAFGLVAYIVYAYRSEHRAVVGEVAPQTTPPAASETAPQAGTSSLSLPLAIILTVGGIALTVLGARFLVSGATGLAQALGVSNALIGLTVVAVGTSLPELVTSIVAAVKREGDIAFGNVVGSNIYNVLAILGITAAVHPIPVAPEIAAFDIWVMLAATAALVAVAVTGWRVTRGEGAALLLAYAAYIAWLARGVL